MRNVACMSRMRNEHYTKEGAEYLIRDGVTLCFTENLQFSNWIRWKLSLIVIPRNLRFVAKVTGLAWTCFPTRLGPGLGGLIKASKIVFILTDLTRNQRKASDSFSVKAVFRRSRGVKKHAELRRKSISGPFLWFLAQNRSQRYRRDCCKTCTRIGIVRI